MRKRIRNECSVVRICKAVGSCKTTERFKGIPGLHTLSHVDQSVIFICWRSTVRERMTTSFKDKLKRRNVFFFRKLHVHMFIMKHAGCVQSVTRWRIYRKFSTCRKTCWGKYPKHKKHLQKLHKVQEFPAKQWLILSPFCAHMCMDRALDPCLQEMTVAILACAGMSAKSTAGGRLSLHPCRSFTIHNVQVSICRQTGFSGSMWRWAHTCSSQWMTRTGDVNLKRKWECKRS